MGEKFGRDSIWETHLGNELLLTDMPIHAVLDEINLPLGDVMNWKVGSQIQLNVKTDDMVELRAGEIPLFRGRMGRHNDHIAVRVEQATISDRKNGQL
jgi:flagellar motor switch protein FliM